MDFSHIDHNGNATMVDVSLKENTSRVATAIGTIHMSKECFEMVKNHTHKKGDVLGVSVVAGIMASKKTSDLIPMCHNINLTNCNISFEEIENGFIVKSEVKCNGQTGVEMEALTSVSIALLTIYDMCKAIDKRMVIDNIHLVNKKGGKSGDFNF